MHDEVEVPGLYRQEVTKPERYRLAGQEFARECGYNVAESVYAGVCAETWHRGGVGDTAAGTFAGAQLEVLCGDPLASRSADQVGTIQSLRFMDWVKANWDELTERATALEISRWRTRGSAFSRAAMELASSTQVTTAAMLYTGAVAAARHVYASGRVDLSDHNRLDRLIELTEKDDPLLALARREMSDLDRAMQQEWVQLNWFEIAPAADDIVLAEDNASLGSTSEQQEQMARHEVTHWLSTLPDGITPTAAFRAYTEAAAVAINNQAHDPDDVHMRLIVQVDDAVIATNAQEELSDEVRAQIREAVRNRWAPLAQLLDD